jgi:hypothetical protein
VLPFGALWAQYQAEVQWLVEGYLACGELTVVPGPPESYKSWALADLARAVHTGGRWLGEFPVPQGGVLFIEQERASNLVYQLARLAAAYACDVDALLVVPPCGLDLHDTQWQQRQGGRLRRGEPGAELVGPAGGAERGRGGAD